MVRCEPVPWEGLTLYPVTMRDYEEFQAAKEALLVMQQSLPVRYVAMPYLQGLYALDYDALRETGHSAGMMGRMVLMLSLALRVEPDRVGLLPSANDPGQLLGLELKQGETTAVVPPVKFGPLRELMCAQNGLQMPDESHNLDLELAERDLAGRDSGLEAGFESLLYSVAVAVGKEPAELDGWAIRRFQETVKAVDRRLNYQMYGTAELSGMVTFRDGNPCPSWCYDKQKGRSRAVVPEGDMLKKLGGSLQQNQ